MASPTLSPSPSPIIETHGSPDFPFLNLPDTYTAIKLSDIDNSSLAKNKDIRGLCIGCDDDVLEESYASSVTCDRCLAVWCSPACAFDGSRGTAHDGSNLVLRLGSYDTHRQLCYQGAFGGPGSRNDIETRRCRALLFRTERESAEVVWVDYHPESAVLLMETPAFSQFEAMDRFVASSGLRLLGKVILDRDSAAYSDDIAHSILLVHFGPVDAPTIPPFVNKSIAALGKPQQLRTWYVKSESV